MKLNADLIAELARVLPKINEVAEDGVYVHLVELTVYTDNGDEVRATVTWDDESEVFMVEIPE